MAIRVFRDKRGERELLGFLDKDEQGRPIFIYEDDYFRAAESNSELGISHLMPPDLVPYEDDECKAFFNGLLPEGDVLADLSTRFQVSRTDYVSYLRQLGCESIGALTFTAEDVDASEYTPGYRRLNEEIVSQLKVNPVRAVATVMSSTRLSLSGAQSKVAWYLSPEIDQGKAKLEDWLEPVGTAPSTHIIKISRHGEEDIALNERACSLIAKTCGIFVPRVTEIEEIPGAIAVERFDRRWISGKGKSVLQRLHQEDFCQALGFQPFYKYQPDHGNEDFRYIEQMAKLISRASSNPLADTTEFAKRLLLCYVLGNTDAHLKNFSLLYNEDWTACRLSPMYDITCIPLTGYSTRLPFDLGMHRMLDEVTSEDIKLLQKDFGIAPRAYRSLIGELVTQLDAIDASSFGDARIVRVVKEVLENSIPRLRVLEESLNH